MSSLHISPSEQVFLQRGVESDMRNDGRGRNDLRPFTLETGVVSQANGSARLKLSRTDVLVGVKVEIGEPHPDRPEHGVLNFSVDCKPSIPASWTDVDVDKMNGDLSRVLEGMVIQSDTLDTKALGIIPHKQCWVVYVDAVVLDNDGSVADALAVATRAALRDTAIPKVTVVPSETPGEMEIELSDDPDDCDRIDVSKLPIVVTLVKIGSFYVVDASIEEEWCQTCRVHVGVNADGKICGIKKAGPGGLDPSSYYDMIQVASEVGAKVLAGMDECMDRNAQAKPVGFLG